MKCLDTKHRYRLVGYRDRTKPKETAGGFIIMDAVMACTRCPEEKLVGVTRTPPAKVIGGTRSRDLRP